MLAVFLAWRRTTPDAAQRRHVKTHSGYPVLLPSTGLFRGCPTQDPARPVDWMGELNGLNWRVDYRLHCLNTQTSDQPVGASQSQPSHQAKATPQQLQKNTLNLHCAPFSRDLPAPHAPKYRVSIQPCQQIRWFGRTHPREAGFGPAILLPPLLNCS